MPAERDVGRPRPASPGWRRWGRYALLVVGGGRRAVPDLRHRHRLAQARQQAARAPVAAVVDHDRHVAATPGSDGNLGRAMLNSTVVADRRHRRAGGHVGAVGVRVRLPRFPGRTFLFAVFLATLLVPFEATVVVNRSTMQDLGWLNSYQGLAVPFLATAFGTFLVRQVFLTLPTELLEAARMDGLGHLGFLREVAVPLVRPTLGALALFGVPVHVEPVPVAHADQHRGRLEHGAERVEGDVADADSTAPTWSSPARSSSPCRSPRPAGVPAPARPRPDRRRGEGMMRARNRATVWSPCRSSLS